jgi:creatinine amidohydrolase
MPRVLLILAALGCLVAPTLTQAPSPPRPDSVFLEDLTWTEVKDALAGGKTTVIIPTGGTEQNGPHIVLGKHNYLVRYKAGEIARQLGNALVAPVVAYVPEGDINPPTSHMALCRHHHDTSGRVRQGAGVRRAELQATRVP